MTITTYSELRAAAADWLVRTDLVAVIPSFIALAEADINRVLRDWRMEKRSTALLDSQYSELPNDWIETVRMQILGQPYRLELVPQGAVAEMRDARRDLQGTPTHYAYTAGALELFPTPDQEYTAELVYVARIPALSDAAPSNWLLAAAPDVYLYGSLIASAPYLKDDPRVAVWKTLYDGGIGALNAASERSKYSGSGLRMARRGLG